MASIYDTAGQVFGRFGSGGRDLAAGQKNSHARLSQFILVSISEQVLYLPSPENITQQVPN